MKQLTLVQNFKETRKSAIAEQIGKKRPSIEYFVNGFEPADVANQDQEKVATILNVALETYAKKLIAEQPTNWDFVPSADDITLDAVYTDLTTDKRSGNSRVLTKESLAKFAAHYFELATKFLGKSEKSALSGQSVIENKLTPILGNSAALDVFSNNLTSLLELEDFDISTHGPVVEALLEIITSAQESEISADSL